MTAVGRREFLQSGVALLALPILPGVIRAARADTTLQSAFLTKFNNAVQLSGISIKLPNNILKTGRPTMVWTDKLVLNGTYETDGGSLFVLARRIEAAPNTVLRTKGSDGSGFDRHADPGPNPGQNGRDGRAGAPGQAGGDIILIADEVVGDLTLDARGGNGGAGQFGGDGAPGPGGSQGTDCNKGGQGGTGGSAGAGGNGGDAGAGGNVWLLSSPKAQIATIIIQTDPGNPGMGGDSGRPGGGGPGGKGGGPHQQPPLPPHPCGPNYMHNQGC